MSIDRPGLYPNLSEEAYHADPCVAPSLSSSIARELLAHSPRHAWWAHPRLNPEYEVETSDRFDLGTAAHAYILEGKEEIVVVDAPDWRSKAAQAARAAARLDGKLAILADRWGDVLTMAARLREQLDRFQERPRPFSQGKPEPTLIWQEGAVWCRARLDWLHDDYATIDDLKTGAVSAHPDEWSRTLFTMGHDLQAAFYARGVRQLGLHHDPSFRFIVQENFAPFAASVIGLAPDAAALAEKKVILAIALWGECLASGEWPAYPTRVCWAQLPSWMETKWVERELREEQRPRGIRDDGRPIEDLLREGR